MSNLAVIQEDVYSVRDAFNQMAGNVLDFEREAKFAIQVISGNEYAMGIAMSNRQSVINAVTNVAAIGISLNPAKRQAYLVPRDRKICLDISYMGLLDLAIQSGSILWGQAELVYKADQFSLNGFDKPPTHVRDPFATDRGDMVGVYVVVKTRDGDYLTACMSTAEVFSIRDRSSAWIAWVDKKRKCPWVTDEGEMVKKTVIKRAYKLWPKTDRLDHAVHYLNTEGGEGLDGIDNHSPATGKGPGVIKPTDGAMAGQSIEDQAYLRELAAESEALFRDVGAPNAFDRIKADNLDSDQYVALWSLLPSDMRTALKKEGEARKAALAAAPINEQQKH